MNLVALVMLTNLQQNLNVNNLSFSYSLRSLTMVVTGIYYKQTC